MKTGFTIIEFLIYIAILVIAVAAMGLVLFNMLRIGTRTDIIQEVSHNGRFAMHRIEQTIKGSSDIIEPETEGDRLVLSFKEPSKSPVIFDVFEGKLRMKEGSEDYIELTTSRVFVDRIFFKKVSADSVKVEINISFHNPQNLPEYDFKSFFSSSFSLGN